jgi:ferric-dicitrate binding protein FerR (iron transport regulator)
VSSEAQYYIELFNRLLVGELSPHETAALVEWLGSDDLDTDAARAILSRLQQPVVQEQLNPKITAALETRLPAILGKKQQPSAPVHFIRRRWMYVAAVILLLLGAGTFLWLNQSKPQQLAVVKPVPVKTDIAPGKTGAILTLADGRQVVLDSMGNGLVATQNGADVSLHNGQLTYNKDGQPVTSVVYNTLSTPKGRQFQVVLPDGTNVWLDAASSLRYPTVFNAAERKVEVTGEAYFEVAKKVDPKSGEKVPFRVRINDQTTIEVLGTHFNINAYDNEASINTTLLEGAVQVIYGKDKAVISPGQQAQIMNENTSTAEQIKVVNDVNIERVMAWKNGVFDFEDVSLGDVMRQLERWYDIDIVYEKGVPNITFIGKMGRDLTLSKVLHGLEISKVHFRIEGNRKLVVLP